MMSSQQPGSLEVGDGVGEGGGGDVGLGCGFGLGPLVEVGVGVPVDGGVEGACVVDGPGAELVGTALVLGSAVAVAVAVAGTMVAVAAVAAGEEVAALEAEDEPPAEVHHGSSVAVLENSLPGRLGKTPDDMASSRQLSPEKRATPPTPARTMAASADSRSTRRRLARGGRAPESKDMGPKNRRIVRVPPPEPEPAADG